MLKIRSVGLAALAAMAVVVACGHGSSGGGVLIDPPVKTALPPLPKFTNVAATVNGDAATVTFDPVDGAADYRIYPLPPDSDIAINPTGSIVVTNGVYRCGGAREELYYTVDGYWPTNGDNCAAGTTIVNGAVEGFTRADADASLGWVYTTAGSGRVPVYAVGLGDKKSDNENAAAYANVDGTVWPVFKSTRQKEYTTDQTQQQALLAAGGRDDGIVFYVPSSAGSNTKPLYEAKINVQPTGADDIIFWVDGAEGTQRGSQGTVAFNVLSAPDTDTAPLQRVHSQPVFSGEHDELVAGLARYRQARFEGDIPVTGLRWAGLTGTTTLVIEALDSGCPNQGFFSPTHLDSFTFVVGDPRNPVKDANGQSTDTMPPWLTFDELKSASPTGEVFLNGQYAATNQPRAIARSFVQLGPAAPPDMDFYAGFEVGTQLEPFTSIPAPKNEGAEYWYDSPTYSLSTYADPNVFFGVELGELWMTAQDADADTLGKVRLTPKQMATIGDSTYLHVTEEVDMTSSQRRYPQIIISDQAPPIQDDMAKGNSLVIQTHNWAPNYLLLQVCDHVEWQPNAQCPDLPLTAPDLPPRFQVPAELAGFDRNVKWDVYVSTSRVYLLLNDVPQSCTLLSAPAADGVVHGTPQGSVSVTFGDVLYHSVVEQDGPCGDLNETGSVSPENPPAVAGQPTTYNYITNNVRFMTRRHFDNLGFKSGVPAPSWDETRFPCASGQ